MKPITIIVSGLFLAFVSNISVAQTTPPINGLVSAEVTCKTSKSGGPSMWENVDISYADFDSGTFGQVSQTQIWQSISTLFPNTQSSGNLTCATAQAVANAAALVFCAAGTLGEAFPFGAIIQLLARWNGYISPTTSLVINNGDTIHQWNFICGLGPV